MAKYKGFKNKTYYAEFLTFGYKVVRNTDAPPGIHKQENIHPQTVLSIDAYRAIAREIPGLSNVKLNLGQSSRSTGYYYRHNQEITLAKNAPYWIFIHEMAHYMNHIMQNGKGHSKSFRGCYLHLVYMLLGNQWGDLLEENFKKVGVSYTLPSGVNTGIYTELLNPLQEKAPYMHNVNAQFSGERGEKLENLRRRWR